MLIDNKTIKDNNPKTIIEFFHKYIDKGNFDIVTGYFSVYMLSHLYKNFKNIEKYRMVLGDIIQDEKNKSKVVDLLNEQTGLSETLELSSSAENAVKFLENHNVIVKTVKPNFCHAKTYIFKDAKNDAQKSFYILGSSNLTDAGLGFRDSSNVELNTANFGSDSDFSELKKWFEELWKNKFTQEKVIIDNKEINFKEYLINSIKNLYKKYTPEELYYKVLYELFKEDLIELDPSSNFQKQVEYLRDTEIYKALFSFQKKGVISLIKKLQDHNGAILADAVGLGKTWQALGVMKFFELQGYKVVLICPKKLENNWRKYLPGHESKFDSDRFNYVIRYHTDMQDTRINNHQDKLQLDVFFQRNPKILFVIDESHNMRNDKSQRYKFFMDNILKQNNDVKVLLLSATPINTKLTDIRNQFKMLVKGDDRGFENTSFGISSLQSLFADAQEQFKKWQEKDERKIADFIKSLSPKFFELSDSLIVARTRDLIKRLNNESSLEFPKKEKPLNKYVSPKGFGSLKTFNDILDALKVNFTAYRPAEYTVKDEVKSVLEDEKQRQKFLAKMMYILLVKRLESSWFAFDATVKNILNHHINALNKVNQYISTKKEDTLVPVIEDEMLTDLEESTDEYNSEQDVYEDIADELTLGKKRPIKISEITQLDKFKKHLEMDIRKFEKLSKQLESLKDEINTEKSSAFKDKSADIKLQKLIEIINAKRENNNNKKVLIFSVYKDTVKYLYNELKERGFVNIAYVAGGEWDSDVRIKGERNRDFEHILERFAPFTKLFNEKDWRKLYLLKDIPPFNNYKDWQEFIVNNDEKTKKQLENPIDILIATDCLSEGQNLQDCDFLINYDIHWNPVRLIQRMGRIDRLASPNKSITGVNFWPAENYDDFLRLRKRVESRMALLSTIGAEIDPDISPDMYKITELNPLLSKQEEKMLEQLQITWDDVEDNREMLGFDKLSLETFRQELFELFQQKGKELEQIPNGVFTGFKANPDLFTSNIPKGIIALIGSPKRKFIDKDFKYKTIHLLYSDKFSEPAYINEYDILSILRKHKLTKRYLPENVENSSSNSIKEYSEYLKKWLDWKAGKKAVDEIQSLFSDGINEDNKPKKTKLEDFYVPENFDLITWFVVS